MGMKASRRRGRDRQVERRFRGLWDSHTPVQFFMSHALLFFVRPRPHISPGQKKEGAGGGGDAVQLWFLPAVIHAWTRRHST